MAWTRWRSAYWPQRAQRRRRIAVGAPSTPVHNGLLPLPLNNQCQWLEHGSC